MTIIVLSHFFADNDGYLMIVIQVFQSRYLNTDVGTFDAY